MTQALYQSRYGTTNVNYPFGADAPAAPLATVPGAAPPGPSKAVKAAKLGGFALAFFGLGWFVRNMKKGKK